MGKFLTKLGGVLLVPIAAVLVPVAVALAAALCIVLAVIAVPFMIIGGWYWVATEL